MSERPTPCPDCGSTYNCYPECHWECDHKIKQLKAENARLKALLPEFTVEQFDMADAVKFGFTWICTEKELVGVPRDALESYVVNKFRAGFLEALEETE